MFFSQKNQQRLAFVFSIFLIILGLTAILNRPGQAQSTLKFDDFFLDKALRINFYMAGNAREEEIIIQDIYQEDIWPESRVNLTNPFNYGHYFIKVYEVASNQLIYAKGFDCQFGEYKTTTPALDGVKKVFQRAVRIPWPKRPVRIVFEARDRQNLLHPLAVESIDPEDYHLLKEATPGGDYTFEVVKNGEPSQKVDLAFLAEGYTAEDRDKFVADVKKFSSFLFEKEPYKSNQNKFNIYGVFRTSLERGMDEPRQKAYKNTALKASFNAFDLDRYMLTEEGFALREMAAQVPYDAIVVLVNSTRYGGGGIYNDYCITTVDHQASLSVFIHEFGHSFAGLADEYYTSDVAYNDFYPAGVEPLEPNITALLDPEHIKWQDLISPGVKIPTDYGKDEIEKLQAEMRANFQERQKALDEAKKKNLKEAETKKIQAKFQEKNKALQAKIQTIRDRYKDLEDKVGAFEGAGYASKGLYRPQMYCVMISSPKVEFCRVCQRAIQQMIDYYSR
ncbi:MAG TPA: M64 family metallopeptidase [Candidatus Saccharicenans sp.]|nr:M64 family metallopeptidase [Candidatus Saccharicenans sp.]HRT25666.1 M64 family metallopeptidase [Candidatus Saccharicenans sp.]HRV05945.1 M64 family metallopeptidase [Candidatus Saccharicenans sp.]